MNTGICICTYKRADLLVRLVDQIHQQDVKPIVLIIVDGYPASNEVREKVNTKNYPGIRKIIYVPSNHANLPYQRFLGWLVAIKEDIGCLIYFDDDICLTSTNSIQTLIEPMEKDLHIVGVTAVVSNGDVSGYNTNEAWVDQRKQSGSPHWFIRFFGSSRKVIPGGVSVVGTRNLPDFQGKPYEEVKWMSGRVMAIRLEKVDKSFFSQDLFAMYELRIGKAEDTFFSRRISTRGKILISFESYIRHPEDDEPQAYPTRSCQYGYAIAYSRKLLNDDCVPFHTPSLANRVPLILNYIGNIFINWLAAVRYPKGYRFSYAWGYMKGAISGITRVPSTKNLTPNIRWMEDAENAVQQHINLKSA